MPMDGFSCGFFYLVVKYSEVCHKLSHIAGFEISGLKLYNDQTVQFSIEKQYLPFVYIFFSVENSNMVGKA